jgi:hypothetical protein
VGEARRGRGDATRDQAMRFGGKSGRPATVGVALAVAMAVGGPAFGLEENAKEREVLKECEKRICSMVVKKEATGADLTCALTKTWAKDDIKEGIEQKKISWSLGDARCSLDLSVPRADIVNAVAKPAHTLDFPKHTIKCEVERDKEITPVKITLKPKIEFKDGKAVKAYLGLGEVEAPAVLKGAIWTVAKIEDTVGLFHGEIIGEVNKFVGAKCPKVLAGG